MLKLRCLFFDALLWGLIPDEDVDNRSRGIAFCAISAAGASVYKQFTARHQRYPFKILQVLLDPARADAIDGDPRCEMDAWSLSIVDARDHRSALGRAKLLHRL